MYDPKKIFNTLVNNKESNQVLTLKWEEIVSVYQAYDVIRKVIILEMENNYYINFPNISSVQIEVEKDSISKSSFQVFKNKEIYDPYKFKRNFINFIIEEFKLNWHYLIIFNLTLILLFLLFNVKINSFLNLNSLFVTVLTIFITIFLVFSTTLEQKEFNKEAFCKGSFYEQLQNDKFILNLAIIALFSSLLISVISKIDFSVVKYKDTIMPFVTSVDFDRILCFTLND